MDGGTAEIEVSQYQQEKQKLYTEGDEVAHGNRQGCDDPGKEDFPEDAGILGKGVGSLAETFGEIVPGGDSGQVKQHGWEAIGGDLGDVAKNHRKDDGGEERLDEKPQRPEDGLLVKGDKVAVHEQHQQVAEMPDLTETEVNEFVFWGYAVFIFGHAGCYILF